MSAPTLDEILVKPAYIHWVKRAGGVVEIIINDIVVGWMEPRPRGCDCGHWMVTIDIPGMKCDDRFPRYYMKSAAAVEESESFLRWQLWKEEKRQ